MRVAIYAGHGGTDPGAVGSGMQEKNLNLTISTLATELLQGRGYTVYNNRTADVIRSITHDANKANNNQVDALVEIHFNSNVGAPGSGSEAYISHREIYPSRTLAHVLLARIQALGFRDRGVKVRRNLRGADAFGILRMTTVPAVLLECAFINNPQDMAKLDVLTMAAAITDSLCEVLNGPRRP